VPGAVDIAPSTNNYEGGFACNLIAKDMQIALETAKDVGASVEAAEMSLQLYK